MSDFKNWKDGDNLTGVQYTNERNQIRNKVLASEEDLKKKSADKFVLSTLPPDFDYAGQIWLNPNQFNTNRDFDITFNTSVIVSGEKRTSFDRSLEKTVQHDFTATGSKIDLISSAFFTKQIDVSVVNVGYKVYIVGVPVEHTITTSVINQGYKEQLVFEDLEKTITTELINQGYKEKIVFEDLENTITTSVVNQGYKEQIISIDLENTITANVINQGYKEEILTTSAAATITASVVKQGIKHQINEVPVVKTIDVSVTKQGQKDLITRTSAAATITASVTRQGSKQQIETTSATATITTGVTKTGGKQVIETVSLSDKTITTGVSKVGGKQAIETTSLADTTITTGVTKVGGRVLSQTLSNLAKTVTTAFTSLTGFKGYSVSAYSNVPFNSVWTFGGSPQSVSIGTTEEIIDYIGTGNTLSISAPSQITINNTLYAYVRTTYLMNGTTTQNTNTTFGVTVTGGITLSFDYIQIPVINVYAKTVDATPGTAFIEEDITFSTLNASNIVQDSDTQPVEPQYALKYQMYDLTGYKLRVNAPASFVLNNITYVIKRIIFKDDNQNTITSTTAQELTYEIGPSVNQNVYVDIEYEEQPTYTLKGAFGVTTSGASSQFSVIPYSCTASGTTTTGNLSRLGTSTIRTLVGGTSYTLTATACTPTSDGYTYYFHKWVNTVPGTYSDVFSRTINAGLNEDQVWIAYYYASIPPNGWSCI